MGVASCWWELILLGRETAGGEVGAGVVASQLRMFYLL